MRQLKQIVYNFSTSAFVILICTCFSQYTGYTALKDIPAFKQKFALESAKVNTITCDFKQVKTLTVLKEKLNSEGKFFFKRSDKVRIDYTKPYTSTVVINGEKLTMKDGDKKTEINSKSSKLLKQLNRIMIDCLQGTVLDNKNFAAQVFENESTYLLELTPTSTQVKEFFSVIVLKIDKSDFTVKSIQMEEPGGDMTIMNFNNKKMNSPVSDALFSI